MVSKDFLKQKAAIENIFYNYMNNNGYSVRIYAEEDVKNMGRGGYAVKRNDDKFSIFFNLNEYVNPRGFFITAKDRNGSSILMGETASIYYLPVPDDMSLKELEDRFKTLLTDIYNKYKNYSKENRLDFVYNELEVERIDYSKIELSNLKQDNIEIEEEIEK